MAGREEPGVNALSRQSSDSIAGIPIKKRRIPLVWSPPPPSQTSSVPVESDQPQKEQFNSKLGSSSSNAGSPTVVSEFSASSNSSSQAEKCEQSNLVQSIVHPPGDNLEEPSLIISFSSVSEMGGKMDDKFAFQNLVEKSELQLASKETLVQQIQAEVGNEGKLMKNDNCNTSKVRVDTELLIAPKENTLAAQNSQGTCREEEKVDPCSWNLGLTKEKNNVQKNCNDGVTKINSTPARTHRSNWDLNTTMDTWESSMNDSTTVHTAAGVGGLDAAGNCEMNPVIYSAEKVCSEREGSCVTSEKQILEKSEHSPDLSSLSVPPEQQHKAEDLLHLSLSTSSGLSPILYQEPSDSRSVISNPFMEVPQSSILNLVGPRTVKSEPSDQINKQDLEESIDKCFKSIDCRTVKSELFEGYPRESHKSSNNIHLRSLGHGAVKSEVNQETLKEVEGTSKPSECYPFIAEMPIGDEALHCSDFTTYTAAIPNTLGMSSSLDFPTTIEMSNNAEVSRQPEFPTCAKGMPSSRVQTKEARETVDEESKVDDSLLDATRTEGFSVADPEASRLKLTDEVNADSYVDNGLAESDDEKINLSTDMQDDYCDTDDESDGNPVVDSKDKHHGGEEDDYEDGEVREPLVHIATNDGVNAKGEAECAKYGDLNGREISVSGFPINECITTTHIEGGNTKIEGSDEPKDAQCSGECDNILPNEKVDQCNSPVASLQESSKVEVATTGTGKTKPIKLARRKPLDHTAREDAVEVHQMELVSDRTLLASQGTSTGGGDDQGDAVSQQDNVQGTNSLETKCTSLSKAEAPVNVTEATKDVNSRGNRSRIINLARTFNGSSSSRMRSIPGRSLPSRIERERLSDIAFGEDKLHPRGIRNDSSIDVGHKFERQRNQDLPVGSIGSDFMHGRGRLDKRLDSPHVNWDTDREFAPESCNGPTGFRITGPKNAAAKAECSGFIVARVGTIVGAGRGGRKPLNDELPSFCHRPSRRRSPGGREGPLSHGVQVVRRSRREISPSRCIGGGGSDLIGLRHEEKFIRGLPDDMMGPVFSHPQPQYRRVDDPFSRGERSFSPIQRRGPINIPRNRSKSPPGSRTRSPGQWPSPRRSPDGFGHPELTHRRSPPFYRVERMRSPHQRPCFADDMVSRRHGSPPFMSRPSNDMGEMVSTREHNHPRSFIPNRSPSGRVLLRGTRRFNMIDPRERTESDEYFGEPMHSGRFQEVGGDGGADVRRICGERGGPVRPFRPPYNDPDIENFRFHVEDGPRSYRLCPEVDADFHERGNLREREFERRIKNRPGNAPRRNRSIEEQEENYRLGEQGWHDVGLEDVSRVKRRRF